MDTIIKHFHSAHPVKKTIILLWFACFVGGILFSIFYLAEHGIKKSFITVFGSGLTVTTVFIYLSIFVIRTLFFIPVSLLMIAAPLIFGGFWIGLLIAGIGEIIGGVVGFLFARYYGQEFFQESAKKSKTMQIINEKMNKFGVLAVGILRLTPVTFDFINFGAGLSQMKFLPYFWVTFFSVWPDCITYVAIGAAIDNPYSLIYNGVIILFLVGLFWYLKQHPKYKEIFVMELQEKFRKIKRKIKSSVSPKKKNQRKKRY